MQPSAHGPHPPSAKAPKSVWREWARSRRRSIDPLETGRAIAEYLERWPKYAAARHVLVYLAFGYEPDLSPLFGGATKTFYTTRTAEPAPLKGGSSVLTLHRLDPDYLERHRFGFLQPSPIAPLVAGDAIDLVLVPGLAFDVTGQRLGFGMGYYDRLLTTFGEDIPRVGITAAALLVPLLPFEVHDVKMTHLATESGLIPVEG